MPECNKCGQPYEGDDCLQCKTTAGLTMDQLTSGVIITSTTKPGENCAIHLEEVVSRKRYPVALPMCKVGRDPQNDIIITGDNGISRNQFVVIHEDGYFYLMDLGSRNGTLLNGKAINERTTLEDGDYIQASGLRFRFLVSADVAVKSGHTDFIRYLESKQADESATKDVFEPSITIDVVLPDEVRAVLDKAFTGQDEWGKKERQAKEEHKVEREVEREVEQKEDHPVECGEDRAQDQKEDNEQGAEQAMTVQEEATTKTPEFCPKYMQEELARLEKEILTLNGVVQEAKKKIQDCEGRIKMMTVLQKSLLSATGDELVEGCARVLQLMNWRVKRADKDKQELLLNSDSGGLVIVRVSWTSPQAAHVDLGTLVISQVYHWCKQKTEPKGIMIVNTLAGGSVPDSGFSGDLEEYAKHKNVCVITTLQLLYMFRELNQNMENAESFQKSLLTTVGVLQGHGAEAAVTPVAA